MNPPCPTNKAGKLWRRLFGNCRLVGILSEVNSPPPKQLVAARRLLDVSPVTLKIETATDGETATLRLIGRLESGNLGGLEAQVRRLRPSLLFGLAEGTVVDVAD